MKTFPIDQIKDSISVFDYARQHLHLPVDRPGARCQSFRAGAANPSSLLIEERHWHDYGSGQHGDVIDMAVSAHGLTWHQAVIRLAGIAGIKLEGASAPTDLDRYATEFHAALTPADRAYLHGRGITDATIDQIKIGRGTKLGLEDRIVIPYWKSGRVAYLVGRGESPKYKKMKRSELSEHPIWGIDTLSRSGPVIIAEGIFDALSVYQVGMPVLTAVTGRFSHEQEKDLFSVLRRRDVTICMDYDPKSEAGQKFTVDLADKLIAFGIFPRVVQLDGKGKKVDLSELYSQGDDIAKVLADGKPYLEIKIGAIAGDEDALRKLLKKCARYMAGPELAKVIDFAKNLDAWNAAWLKTLAAELRQPPTDDLIVKELRDKKRLLYHEQLGWFEYDNRGVWAGRCDTEIKAYIAEILRHYRTGNRLGSAFAVAKTDLIRQAGLNMSPLLNLRNGMLCPETQDLKPHSADYYSTIQIGYNYNPEAACPLWTDFIEQITDGDEKRQMFIQEMFGYCLTTDVRYQVAFFLIGSGANGKSVLLDVLRAVVGSENVSNVEVSSLCEPFQRISLHGKLVNFATETDSDVSGTEQIFKQIVAGDPISGCYKGKDFIVFRPFAKCLFAANQYSEGSDLTKGFMRRIRFLRFPVEFTDRPVTKGQMKRDNKITEKLLDELPGILNWALIGLAALRENDGFSETEDNARMHQEYIEFNDPLELWMQDYRIPDEWTDRGQIYDVYAAWCKTSNCFPMSVKRFWPRLREKVDIVERRISIGRQVRTKPII